MATASWLFCGPCTIKQEEPPLAIALHDQRIEAKVIQLAAPMSHGDVQKQ
jgi:hypothetical protein